MIYNKIIILMIDTIEKLENWNNKKIFHRNVDETLVEKYTWINIKQVLRQSKSVDLNIFTHIHK